MIWTREKLIEELYKPEYWMEDSRGFKKLNIGAMAGFIINDRKRIVEPLVKAYLHPDFPKFTMNTQLNRLHEGTVEVLKNAGVSI